MLRILAVVALCAHLVLLSGCGRESSQKKKNFLQQYHEETEKEVDELEKSGQ